jgi:hypothetical protein
VIKRGARLKALFGVNGSQNASRSLVWRVAKLPISLMIVSLFSAGNRPKAALFQHTVPTAVQN